MRPTMSVVETPSVRLNWRYLRTGARVALAPACVSPPHPHPHEPADGLGVGVCILAVRGDAGIIAVDDVVDGVVAHERVHPLGRQVVGRVTDNLVDKLARLKCEEALILGHHWRRALVLDNVGVADEPHDETVSECAGLSQRIRMPKVPARCRAKTQTHRKSKRRSPANNSHEIKAAIHINAHALGWRRRQDGGRLCFCWQRWGQSIAGFECLEPRLKLCDLTLALAKFGRFARS